jgi:restriction endonuclease S subunit
VRITDIDEQDGLREETFKSLPIEVAEEYLLQAGDLLFARSGATAGKTFLYRSSWGVCAYAGYLIRARLDTSKVCPEFARYFTATSSYWQWLSAAFIQATIQNVSAERYASLLLPQPPLQEQRAIATFLDRETARIVALTARVRDAIDRLRELRTALISAAVTGKIDVREDAA